MMGRGRKGTMTFERMDRMKVLIYSCCTPWQLAVGPAYFLAGLAWWEMVVCEKTCSFVREFQKLKKRERCQTGLDQLKIGYVAWVCLWLCQFPARPAWKLNILPVCSIWLEPAFLLWEKYWTSDAKGARFSIIGRISFLKISKIEIKNSSRRPIKFKKIFLLIKCLPLTSGNTLKFLSCFFNL